MLDDLESIHNKLIEAYKLLSLLSGIDLDALVEQFANAGDNEGAATADEKRIFYLPI